MDKLRGGRRRERLSPSDEESFLQSFFEQAARGGVLIVNEIHRVYPPVQYEATKAELMASYCTGGYIHLGGLDLMPAGVTYPTHTKV